MPGLKTLKHFIISIGSSSPGSHSLGVQDAQRKPPAGSEGLGGMEERNKRRGGNKNLR